MWAIVEHVSYDGEGNIGHALRRAGPPPVRRTVAIHCGPAAATRLSSRHDRPERANRSGIEKRRSPTPI
jgi:hypothetical protein